MVDERGRGMLSQYGRKKVSQNRDLEFGVRVKIPRLK